MRVPLQSDLQSGPSATISFRLAPRIPSYRKTPTDTDVLVVGGGIAGLQIAYELLLKGQQVTLVEDGCE
jgi:NADPH-dependent 2,4-dienoyl-CoA reductase/sulfur reductase-like enzyme